MKCTICKKEGDPIEGFKPTKGLKPLCQACVLQLIESKDELIAQQAHALQQATQFQEEVTTLREEALWHEVEGRRKSQAFNDWARNKEIGYYVG